MQTDALSRPEHVNVSPIDVPKRGIVVTSDPITSVPVGVHFRDQSDTLRGTACLSCEPTDLKLNHITATLSFSMVEYRYRS